MRRLSFLLLVAACGGAKATHAPTAAAGSFDPIAKVLDHPRCRNCHIPGDSPLVGDDSQPHPMFVVRGTEGKGAVGLECQTCHGAANLPAGYDPHAPPGAPNWHLPPPERKMVFIGKSPAEICRGLKDTAQNGGKNLAQLLEHMAADKLVLWGWNPGPGRAPVSVPHDEVVAQFKAWVDAGGPCPGG